MKKRLNQIAFAAAFLLAASAAQAQVGVGIPATDIHASAQLDVSSTTKGFLPPRMIESQRNAIASPAAGLMIWCSDCGTSGEVQVYNGSVWTNMVGAAAAGSDLTPHIAIGNQVWATKNLDVAKYRDGTPIPHASSGAQWQAAGTAKTGAWCWYDNDSATYAATYGRLYNWYAVAGIYNGASLATPSLRKQLAPAGYHVPSDSEWNKLVKFLDPTADTTCSDQCAASSSAGLGMKATSGWAAGGNGTNSTGLALVPGGVCTGGGNFAEIGLTANLWSSSQIDNPMAYYRFLYNVDTAFNRNSFYKQFGFSVRCLKD